MSKSKDVGGRASIEAKPGLDLKNAVRQLLPRRLGPHRILAGPLRGRRIFTSWHDYPAAILGRTEVALINWLRRNVSPGETWLDIGAHYGYTAIAICELVGPHGRVFAFEPLLATAGYLSLTRDLNAFQQLTIVPFGLDDSTSMRTLQVATRRGMATPLEGDVAPHTTIYLTGFEAVWDMLADPWREDGRAGHGDRSFTRYGTLAQPIPSEACRGNSPGSGSPHFFVYRCRRRIRTNRHDT